MEKEEDDESGYWWRWRNKGTSMEVEEEGRISVEVEERASVEVEEEDGGTDGGRGRKRVIDGNEGRRKALVEMKEGALMEVRKKKGH